MTVVFITLFLFVEASAGKCNDPKPGAFDFVGKAKWTAWNDLGDLSKVGINKLSLPLSGIKYTCSLPCSHF